MATTLGVPAYITGSLTSAPYDTASFYTYFTANVLQLALPDDSGA